MRARSWLRGLAFIAGTTVLAGGSHSASAQDIPFDPAIDVQLFEYATGPHSFITVPDADVTGAKQFALDFIVTFITDPFTIYNVNEVDNEITTQRTEVVKSVAAGELSGAYGLGDRFQLSAALPMVFSMAGDGLDPTTAMPTNEGIQVTGFGDLRLEFKMRLWQQERLRLAVISGLTIPTSFGAGGSDFLGDDLPSARGRAVLQWSDNSGNLTLGANVGAIFRKPRTIYSSEVGQQLTYGVAGNFSLTSSLNAIAELFGRTGLTGLDLDASPMEGILGMRIQATKSVSVVAGGGAGLLKGIGSPGLRVFASVGWSPDYRDQDHDGIPNLRDQCPLLKEDFDDFEDSDGCPDQDNDGDKREDSVDKCPMEKEDLDGFEDDDGCPEADNDNDGFIDTDDRCPVDPEDGKAPYEKDGCPADKRDSDDDGIYDAFDQCVDEPEDLDDFEDWDGCPDVDNDADDIPDEYDNCPVCKEDADGTDDDDGCPEPDNDRDGILDPADNCPNEAEVVNGIDDFDGCPDDGGVALAHLDGDRVILETSIDFAPGGTLTRRGIVVVDQVAVTMLAHPEVTKWRIVAAAAREGSDERTRQLSQARADAVRAYLGTRGITASSIEAIGAVSDDATVVIVVRERAEADPENPICPAGFEVTPRPAPEQPATSEASTPAAPAAEPTAPVAPTAAKEVPPQLTSLAGTSGDIRFKRGTPVLRTSSRKVLDSIATLMVEHDHVTLMVVCHTDNKKGEQGGRELTTAQAEVVVAYLEDKGVPAGRVVGLGKGMDEPISSNRSSTGRKENRRTELVFGTR